MDPIAADFPWYLFFTAMTFAWGACFGSYLNVCVYRIPLEISTALPASHCPYCKTPIKWYHNIPILAWLALRGKCAACKHKFSARYMVVELLTALLFLLVWFKLDWYAGSQLFGISPPRNIFFALRSGLPDDVRLGRTRDRVGAAGETHVDRGSGIWRNPDQGVAAESKGLPGFVSGHAKVVLVECPRYGHVRPMRFS